MRPWTKLPPPDKQRILFGLVLTCFVTAALVKNVQLMVIFIAVGLLGCLGAIWVLRDTETEALRASIEYSREEITDTIKTYIEYLQNHPEDTALGPVSHSELFTNQDSQQLPHHPAVTRFRTCFEECRTHLDSLPPLLEDDSLTTKQLQEILTETDNHASRLRESWKQARRAVHAQNREAKSHARHSEGTEESST